MYTTNMILLKLNNKMHLCMFWYPMSQNIENSHSGSCRHDGLLTSITFTTTSRPHAHITDTTSATCTYRWLCGRRGVVSRITWSWCCYCKCSRCRWCAAPRIKLYGIILPSDGSTHIINLISSEIRTHYR